MSNRWLLSPRWLRWGLAGAGSYLALVGLLLFVVTPLGRLLNWFGPIVSVGLLALLHWPMPSFRVSGVDPGTIVLSQVPFATVMYFLLGVGLGVIWPGQSRRPRRTTALLFTVGGCLVLLGFVKK